MPTPSPKPDARLTTAQIATQLRLARECFTQSGFVTASLRHTPSGLHALDLITQDEQEVGIQEALCVITPSDYRGPHPPDHLSREPKCKGLRMLQFAWRSTHFNNRQTYLKFCLQDGRFILFRPPKITTTISSQKEFPHEVPRLPQRRPQRPRCHRPGLHQR